MGAVQTKKKGGVEELSPSPGKSMTKGRGLCKHLTHDKMWYRGMEAVPGYPHGQTQQRRAARGVCRARRGPGIAWLRC